MPPKPFPRQSRIFCEHCKTFYYNNAISKKSHEASPRHQNALARRLREARERTHQEKQSAFALNRELAKIDAAAGGAFMRDVKEGRASHDPSSSRRVLLPISTMLKQRGFSSESQEKKPAASKAVTASKRDEKIQHMTKGVPGAWEIVPVLEANHLFPAPPVDIRSEEHLNGSDKERIDLIHAVIKEGEDNPDGLLDFRVIEKSLDVPLPGTDEVNEPIVFRKRKQEDGGKKRNIRKKT